jgi:putative intracellular protease/amidase
MKPIATILTEGFADWETGLISGGAEDFGVNVILASPGGVGARSMGGLRAEGLARAEDLDPADFSVIALCGGTIWGMDKAPDLSALLSGAVAAGTSVAGICGATLALARAGLLDTRAHTSNRAGYIEAHVPAYSGASRYRDQPAAVSDQGVITASGIAPVSFAAEVFLAAGAPREAAEGFRATFAAEHG